jgi:hypothetical protein
MKDLTQKETAVLKECIDDHIDFPVNQQIKAKLWGRSSDEIHDDCSQHVDLQLDLHFQSIADEFDVDSGDITPDQSMRLSEIARQLTELSVEYVKQNKGY